MNDWTAIDWIANTILVVVAGCVITASVRRPRGAIRFGIALRRSPLRLATQPPWRWSLFPRYTPEIDLTTHPTSTPSMSGRARTYLGALYAANRARRQLEQELAADRARFVAQLRAGVRPTFPAETRGHQHRPRHHRDVS